MYLRGAAVALCCTLAAGQAPAAGWTINDLGSIDTEAGCVDLAWEVFARFRGSRSVGEIKRDQWVVYGYELSSNDFDGVITCAYGPNEKTRATLVVYSVDDADSERRGEIANRLARYWEQMK
jgi:hypothetical protein